MSSPGLRCWMAVAVMSALAWAAWPGAGAAAGPRWLVGARIATPYDVDLDGWTWERGVDRAVADGADVILDWQRFSDDWQALFDPVLAQSLEEAALKAAYVHGHHPGVHYIVYIGPLEYVTADVDRDGDGRVDPGQEGRALSVQHPEWAQTGIDGRRAVFFGAMPEMPFWVCPSCEDVWVTPAEPGFRRLVLDQIRRIAATGIDGLWLDVPFLRSEYGPGWTGQWADVGPSARQLLSAQTGHVLPAPPFSPEWSDPAWQAYVVWRHRLIREFLADVRAELAAAAPGMALVVESSVGFAPDLTQTAASPFEIPAVCDTTAHETGGTERAVQRSRWLLYAARMTAWRHLDLRFGEPSWLLDYAFSGSPQTVPLARLHAAAALALGYGFHVSGNETMSGVPDAELRRELFGWMAGHSGELEPELARPLATVAVLLSQRTLDFRDRGSWESGEASDGFRGMLMALLESHVPFEVLGDGDLDRLDRFTTLILPGVEALGDAAAERIRAWVRGGGRLLATGLTSAWNDRGAPRPDFALADLFGVHLDEVTPDDERVFESFPGSGHVVFTAAPHERWYFWAGAPWDESGGDEAAMGEERGILEQLLARLDVPPVLSTDAPRDVLLFPFVTRSGGLRIGVLNLLGTGAGDAVPEPVSFHVTLHAGESRDGWAARWLELLGESRALPVETTPEGPRCVVATTAGGLLSMSSTVPGRRPAGRTRPPGAGSASARAQKAKRVIPIPQARTEAVRVSRPVRLPPG